MAERKKWKPRAPIHPTVRRALALMAAAVRTERERRQMTDEEMAEAIGVTVMTYRNLE